MARTTFTTSARSSKIIAQTKDAMTTIKIRPANIAARANVDAGIIGATIKSMMVIVRKAKRAAPGPIAAEEVVEATETMSKTEMAKSENGKKSTVGVVAAGAMSEAEDAAATKENAISGPRNKSNPRNLKVMISTAMSSL